MSAEVKAFAWDIHRFNGINLSESNVRKLLGNESARQALQGLTEFALETDKAKKIAVKLPEKQFLHFSIAYDKQKGLSLIFQETVGCQNKIKEQIVAKSDDEKLRQFTSQIEFLEGYIDAIKTLEKPFKNRSIKPENTVRLPKEVSSKKENKTNKKTQKIFDRLIKENKQFVKKKSTYQKIVGTIEVLFVAADVDGVVRNTIDAVTKSAAAAVNYLLGVGGALLVLSGISSMCCNGLRIAHAATIKSFESIFLSVVDFLSSSGITVAGSALLVNSVATLKNMASLASNAFSVIPYTLIVTNCLCLASIIYQIVMVVKFKLKLSQLSSEDSSTQDLINTLQWLSTTLKPSKSESQNTDDRERNIIAKKWSEFQVKAGEKAFAFIEKLLSKDSSVHIDHLLNDLVSNSEKKREKALIMAKDIVESLKEESTKNLLFLGLRAVASVVIISVAIGMLLDAGAGSSLIASVCFAVASIISLIIDCTPLRTWFLTKFEHIKDWFAEHIEKIKERVKIRIEQKDIGMMGFFVDIEKHEKHLVLFAWIAEILAYTIENIQDSKLLPFFAETPLIGALIKHFCKDTNVEDDEDVSSIVGESDDEVDSQPSHEEDLEKETDLIHHNAEEIA